MHARIEESIEEKHVGNGGRIDKNLRKEGIAAVHGGSQIAEVDKHGRIGGNESYSSAAAAARASASASGTKGGMGGLERPRSV